MKVQVKSHVPRVISLPWPHHTAAAPCKDVRPAGLEFITIPPGATDIEEEVLRSYAEHPGFKPLLLAGNFDGIEIVSVDGEKCPHTVALEEFYPGKTAAELQELVRAAQEKMLATRQAEEEIRMKATSPTADNIEA